MRIGNNNVTAIDVAGQLKVNANGANNDFTLPAGRGTTGQVLSTDGSGTTSWIAAAVGNTGWSLTGNSGIIAATNFMGTTDAQPLSFRVNNIWSGQIHPSNGNTSYGLNAFNSSSTGTNNTANGASALSVNTTGSYNTANGASALFNNTVGSGNTANGPSSLFNNSTGANNTAIGASALSGNTTGSNNTALGFNADVSANNLTNATAIGNSAVVDASNKVRIGNNSVTAIDVAGQLKVNANGASNDFTLPAGRGTTGQVLSTDGAGTTSWIAAAVGNTGWNLIGNTGINSATNFMGTTDVKPLNFRVNNTWSGQIHPSNGNTSYGLNAFNSSSTGTNNTANGLSALQNNTTGFTNTANGVSALLSNTTGTLNTANGGYTLLNNTSGGSNTANGVSALESNTTGSINTGNGLNALKNNTTGSSNSANGTNALLNNISGANNTANGYNALNFNTTGSFNTALGNSANVGSNNLTNATAIGNGAVVDASNKVRIGNNSVTAIDVAGQLKVNANGASNDFMLPAGRGTSGQFLSTDGSGVTSWTTAGGQVSGFTHYLGEDFNGGIIYYLYKGSDGLEHGLIVSKNENTAAAWQTTGSLRGADRTEDGVFNTNLMTNSPAASYIATLGLGWYLPSVDELNLLYYNRYSAQKGLRAGGFTLLANASQAFYWSSTEFSATYAYSFSFSNGQPNTSFLKTNNTISVRGIRAF